MKIVSSWKTFHSKNTLRFIVKCNFICLWWRRYDNSDCKQHTQKMAIIKCSTKMLLYICFVWECCWNTRGKKPDRAMVVQVVKITRSGTFAVTKSDNMRPLSLIGYFCCWFFPLIFLLSCACSENTECWARISKFVLMELHNDFCDVYSSHVK